MGEGIGDRAKRAFGKKPKGLGDRARAAFNDDEGATASIGADARHPLDPSRPVDFSGMDFQGSPDGPPDFDIEPVKLNETDDDRIRREMRRFGKDTFGPQFDEVVDHELREANRATDSPRRKLARERVQEFSKTAFQQGDEDQEFFAVQMFNNSRDDLNKRNARKSRAKQAADADLGKQIADAGAQVQEIALEVFQAPVDIVLGAAQLYNDSSPFAMDLDLHLDLSAAMNKAADSLITNPSRVARGLGADIPIPENITFADGAELIAADESIFGSVKRAMKGGSGIAGQIAVGGPWMKGLQAANLSKRASMVLTFAFQSFLSTSRVQDPKTGAWRSATLGERVKAGLHTGIMITAAGPVGKRLNKLFGNEAGFGIYRGALAESMAFVIGKKAADLPMGELTLDITDADIEAAILGLGLGGKGAVDRRGALKKMGLTPKRAKELMALDPNKQKPTKLPEVGEKVSGKVNDVTGADQPAMKIPETGNSPLPARVQAGRVRDAQTRGQRGILNLTHGTQLDEQAKRDSHAIALNKSRVERTKVDQSTRLVAGLEAKLRPPVRFGKIRGLFNQPVARQMEDIGAIMDGGPNYRTGESLASLKARETPVQRRVRRELQSAFESGRRAINAYLDGTGKTEYINQLENYLPHVYIGDKATISDGIARFIKNSPNAKKRKIPTLAEAVEAGLVPRTQNAGELYKHWAAINWRVAANRATVEELRTMKDSDGNMAIQNRDGAPDHFIPMNNDIVNTMRVRGVIKGQEGKPDALLMFPNGAMVNPAVKPAIEAMLNNPAGTKFGRGVRTLNSVAKSFQLNSSFFHDIALLESANNSLALMPGTGPGRFNFMRGFVILGEIDPALGRRLWVTTPGRRGARLRERGDIGLRALEQGGPELARSVEIAIKEGKNVLRRARRAGDEMNEDMFMAGLITGSEDAQVGVVNKFIQGIDDATVGHPLINKPVKAIQGIRAAREKMLWGYHSNAKAATFYDLSAHFTKNAPVEHHKKINEIIAKVINDAYGGQEMMNTMLKNPRVRQAVQMTLLAPDWTLSNARIAFPQLGENNKAVLKPGGKPVNVAARIQGAYWRNSLITYSLMAYGVQTAGYIAFGDPEKGDVPFPHQNPILGGKQQFVFSDLIPGADVHDFGMINEAERRMSSDSTPLARAVHDALPPEIARLIVPRPDVHQVEDPETGEMKDVEQRVMTKTGKQMWELTRYMTRPTDILYSKGSPMLRAAMAQFTGAESALWWSDFANEEKRTGDFDLLGRVKAAGSQFIPFSLRGGQTMFALPTGRGMSASKFNKGVVPLILSMSDDPDVSRTQGDFDSFEEYRAEALSDWLDSARRNGLDAEDEMKRALVGARSQLYEMFYEAVQRGDEEEMDVLSTRLVRLHSEFDNLLKSVEMRNEKARVKGEDIVYDDDFIEALSAQWESAVDRAAREQAEIEASEGR